MTEGYAAAAPTLSRALRLVLDLDVANDEVGRWLWLAGGRATVWLVALELWDADSWHALVTPQARFARDLGAGPIRALIDITLPLMRTNLLSSFVFAFLLSLNEHARSYYLVGRQNTLPLYIFGAMSSGASPTIYAFSGAVISIAVVIITNIQ